MQIASKWPKRWKALPSNVFPRAHRQFSDAKKLTRNKSMAKTEDRWTLGISLHNQYDNNCSYLLANTGERCRPRNLQPLSFSLWLSNSTASQARFTACGPCDGCSFGWCESRSESACPALPLSAQSAASPRLLRSLKRGRLHSHAPCRMKRLAQIFFLHSANWYMVKR